MTSSRLILASASPRREHLLRELGVAFEIVPCPLPEPVQRPAHVTPPRWAQALAYFKAMAVAEIHPDCWVLGADTVVVCDDVLLGKPRNRVDAERMLTLQAGRASDVVTGVALVRYGATPQRRLAHATTTVWMRDDAARRAAYLATDDWQGKAGAYGIQTVGDELVERLDGSFSNVVGLPLELTRRLLALCGVPLPAVESAASAG